MSKYIKSIEMSTKILAGNASRLYALAEAFHNTGNAETGEILRSVAADITAARDITTNAVYKEQLRITEILEATPFAHDQTLGTDDEPTEQT